jgi:hypothetical protein
MFRLTAADALEVKATLGIIKRVSPKDYYKYAATQQANMKVQMMQACVVTVPQCALLHCMQEEHARHAQGGATYCWQTLPSSPTGSTAQLLVVPMVAHA